MDRCNHQYIDLGLENTKYGSHTTATWHKTCSPSLRVHPATGPENDTHQHSLLHYIFQEAELGTCTTLYRKQHTQNIGCCVTETGHTWCFRQHRFGTGVVFQSLTPQPAPQTSVTGEALPEPAARWRFYHILFAAERIAGACLSESAFSWPHAVCGRKRSLFDGYHNLIYIYAL